MFSCSRLHLVLVFSASCSFCFSDFEVGWRRPSSELRSFCIKFGESLFVASLLRADSWCLLAYRQTVVSPKSPFACIEPNDSLPPCSPTVVRLGLARKWILNYTPKGEGLLMSHKPLREEDFADLGAWS